MLDRDDILAPPSLRGLTTIERALVAVLQCHTVGLQGP